MAYQSDDVCVWVCVCTEKCHDSLVPIDSLTSEQHENSTRMSNSSSNKNMQSKNKMPKIFVIKTF